MWLKKIQYSRNISLLFHVKKEEREREVADLLEKKRVVKPEGT